MSKRLSAVLAVLLMVLGLGACGEGANEQPPSSSGSGKSDAQQSRASDEFPVQVKHKYGTTEIDSPPERVVTLGLSDQDAVLALGVKPVGAIDWFKERPYGKWPWTDELWGEDRPTIVGERDDYNLEKIFELKPDLIIALYSGMSDQQYETLSKIAPVVGQPPDYPDYAAPWQEMTRLAGKALGKSERAEQLITEIDEKFAQVRKEHPEFDGKSTAVVDPYQPGEYAVFAPHDPKVVFMTELGFRVPEPIEKAAGDKYAAEISSERASLMDVDRLIFLTSDPNAEKRVRSDEVYSGLNVAKEKRDLFVPYGEPPVGAAISFSTVLSIPYAIDQMVPLLSEPTD